MNLKLQRALYALQEAATDDKGAGGAATGATGGTAGGTGGEGVSGGDPGAGAATGGAAASGGDDGKPAAGADGKPAGSGDGSAGTGDGTGKVTDEGPWGADWRNKMAGGDEAALKRLARYADPVAAAKALSSLQERISKGELRSPLPKDATADQVKAWRAENGIPEAPDKYDLGELKVNPLDKPIIDSFLATAHARNMTAEQTRDAIGWYYAEVERVGAKRVEKDKAAARAAEDTLREAWGNNEYRANIASVQNLLATAPADVKDNLMYGRLADGTPILAHAGTVQYLLGLALEINPASTLELPGSGSRMDAVDTELKSIEKVMREDRGTYNKDEKMQARYRDLLGAKEKLQERSK